MGLMQDKLADDLRDCLRVAAVQVCGRAVLAETNHVFHAGFVRRSAVLQHPIGQVELDQGKRRARFVGISSRDYCAIAVAQRDLSTPGHSVRVDGDASLGNGRDEAGGEGANQRGSRDAETGTHRKTVAALGKLIVPSADK
ncbi:hypothetical protein ACL1EX_02930 [Corynebacterium striatum]